ncbi:unnamed protein product [Cercopithifilaria johnstoni]|uniref:Uncharacterized protein n=1 Tax=Cercopithifilaria johnstoni TaxID=2874296 RepID=A0A8J2LYV0_9BILA|nr:unnamed protein product [Cercopithifilaria johnstoni]
MVKSPKTSSNKKSFSSLNKKSSSKSPRRKDSTVARGQSRKTSRSSSRSRSIHSTPRSRSSSRGRGSFSRKKTISPVVKKFDDSAVKKIVPLYYSPKNNSSYKTFPFTDKGIQRPVPTMRLLQPMNVNNLKIKGVKLKRRLYAHCKRLSRFYIITAVLVLIGLGIFYTGYTIDQMAKYARKHIDFVTTYVKKRD